MNWGGCICANEPGTGLLGLPRAFFVTSVRLIAAHGGVWVDGGLWEQDEDSDVVLGIKELLQSKIRPTIRNDGGDIRCDL